MKTILIPIDFSKESIHALNSAHGICSKSEGKIILLHVIEDPHFETFHVMGESESYSQEENIYIIQLKRAVQNRLEQIIYDEKYKNIELEYQIRIGNPFHTITEVISEENVDMIVMGSKGSKGLTELFVGSNADKVIRHAHCPVITIKNEADLTNIKSIVFATGLDDDQFQVIPHLRALQSFYTAKLHLVKIYDSDIIDSEYVENKLRSFAEENGLENYSVSARENMDEADGIIEFSKEVNAGMIALATHDRKGLSNIFGTKISKHVVNHGMIPVWTKTVKEII